MSTNGDSTPHDLKPKVAIEAPDAAKKNSPGTVTRPPGRNSKPQKPNYHKIHANPLPLVIHPLPAFIPHNPLSFFRLAYVFLSHVFSPPSSHVKPLYKGYFSRETGSIHVTDPATIRALWEKGFFGKGTLSRSEPTWLETERFRQGVLSKSTAEENTQKRRQERKKFKQERAIKEQEAIEEQRRMESSISAATSAPQENSETAGTVTDTNTEVKESPESLLAPTFTSNADNSELQFPNYEHAQPKPSREIVAQTPLQESGSSLPTQTTERLDSPPTLQSASKASIDTEDQEPPPKDDVEISIPNQEHLQLTLSEAFFLQYALGVFDLVIPDGPKPTNSSLLELFRQHSYFPPRAPEALEPDDNFLLNYAVYHHFRSLGWVVRPGIKFSVDYLLYNRGPVFAHAAFAVLIIPAYVDPFWSSSEEKRAYVAAKAKSQNWHWLHSVNRVQTQVLKTLVLAYVEVPAPAYVTACTEKDDIERLLKGYKIRDVILKRWVPQRNLK